MQRYTAFLSGLPTGRSGVSMDSLRRLLRELGLASVETYLSTGNVIFETPPVGNLPPLEGQISRFLSKRIGTRIDAFIRTPAELSGIVSSQPFRNGKSDEGSIFVVLLHETLSARAERELRFARTAADSFVVRGREIYWLRRAADAGAAPTPELSEALEGPATVRSLRTLERLAQKYGGKGQTAAATESARSRP